MMLRIYHEVETGSVKSGLHTNSQKRAPVETEAEHQSWFWPPPSLLARNSAREDLLGVLKRCRNTIAAHIRFLVVRIAE